MPRFHLVFVVVGLLLTTLSVAHAQTPRIGVFADPEARFDFVCPTQSFVPVDFYIIALGAEAGLRGYEFTIDLSDLEATGFRLLDAQTLLGTQDLPSDERFVVTLDECVSGSVVPLVKFVGVYVEPVPRFVEVCIAGIERDGVVGLPQYLDCSGSERDFDFAGSFSGCMSALAFGECCPSEARVFTAPETVASPGAQAVTVPVQFDRVYGFFREPASSLCTIWGYYGFRTTVAFDPLQLELVDPRMTTAVPEGWILHREDLAPGLVAIEITDPREHGGENSRQLVDPDGATILELDFDLLQPGISNIELRDTELCWLSPSPDAEAPCSYGYESPITLSTTVTRPVALDGTSFGTLKSHFRN